LLIRFHVSERLASRGITPSERKDADDAWSSFAARAEKLSLAAKLRGKLLIDPYGSSDVPG